MKAKVSDETCFRKDKDKTVNVIPNEKTKYNCRVLLQIKTLYNNNNEDENCYTQVFLQSCRYKFLANNRLMFLILQIPSQRVNLKKSLMKILNKDITTHF